MDIEIDGKIYKCNASVAELLRRATIVKFTIGDIAYMIRGAEVIQVYVNKIVIGRSKIEYEVSADANATQGLIANGEVLYLTEEDAILHLQKITY